MAAKPIYAQSAATVLKNFNSTLAGLDTLEASKRLQENGKNTIKIRRNWHVLRLILNQLNDELVWILLLAALLSLFFKEYRDASIIGIIVFINGLIGFLQEFKAERVIASLKKLVTDKAFVYRDGEQHEIDTSDIVPGDIVFVSSGEDVPADGYILESFEFRVNSFIFTGESRPSKKQAHILSKENVSLAEIDNMVFMGESVAVGEAKYVVTGTGSQTELGKIASLTSEVKTEATPLQKRMKGLSRRVGFLSLVIATGVVGVGWLNGIPLDQSFMFALAMAVSVVPEGLPAAISVALSFGMNRLLKHHVIVKKLSAVETLGSVNIICTDKTGTITKNELMVTRAVVNNKSYDLDGDGYDTTGNFFFNGKKIDQSGIKELYVLNKIGTLCNDATLLKQDNGFKVIGDPTEGAIIVAGRKFDNRKDCFFEGERKISENPFSSDRMRMSVIYKGLNTMSYVKGSPDTIIELSNNQLLDGKVVPFTDKDKEMAKSLYNQMSSEALRVLAFAYRPLDGIMESEYGKIAEADLIWVGMMAMIDPPRKNVNEAILKCKQLGVKVIMITGDYEITAEAIAKNIGLIDKPGTFEIINGRQLDKLSDSEIYSKTKEKEVVFARISPEQKLRIATILKDNGEIIAMTGDGVNDAPALKRADIGVAMGEMGTDVSKEAAEMILLNDNFSSIVNGIEEGRTIYSNLRKFVYFVFTANTGELLTVIMGLLLGLPSPLAAVQILSIDLGTNMFPAFALGLEPEEPDVLTSAKPKKNQSIMSRRDVMRLIYVGFLMALTAVSAFWHSMHRGGWHLGQPINTSSLLYIRSTTAAYAALAICQLANMLQARSAKYSIFKIGVWRNPYAIFAIFFACITLNAQSEQQFAELGNLKLVSGETIYKCKIGYRTFGTLNTEKTNAVLYPTWFGGKSESLANLIGPDKVLDSEEYFVIAVDALGNGVSSSPSNCEYQSNRNFPEITIKDMVNSQYKLLTEHLGIKKLHGMIGGSMGGMQVFEWIVSYPDFMEKAITYVGSPKLTSFDILHWQSVYRVGDRHLGDHAGDEFAEVADRERVHRADVVLDRASLRDR
ncbi:HAD-IC family P-type ATPase, partial [Candidatus Falkowbacteria bacterium]|nr:HAD-IC family P-type ATPase [Candidatus Falkowbacteria bacterium]